MPSGHWRKRRFDAEVDSPEVSPHKVALIATELRQLEVNIGKRSVQLDPNMEQHKSQRHVDATNTSQRHNSLKRSNPRQT